MIQRLTLQGSSAMRSFPPLSTTFSLLDVNLYWLLLTLGAWSVFCGLVGYMAGYLRRQPKYIILRDSDIRAKGLSNTQIGAAENSLK